MNQDRREKKTWEQLRKKLAWSHWAPVNHPHLDEFLEEQFLSTRTAVKWAMIMGTVVLVLRGLVDISNGVAAPPLLEMGWRIGFGVILGFCIYAFQTSANSRIGQIWMNVFVVGLIGSICGTLHLAHVGREATTLIPIVLVYLLSTGLWTSAYYLRLTLLLSSLMVAELFVFDIIPVEYQKTYAFYILVGIAGGMVIRYGRLQTAFDNFLLRRHLAAQAMNDPLTGVLNRTGWDNRLIGTLKAGQPMQPSSLLFFDLDHFKKINDVHGHAVGDEVLKHASKMIQGGLREGDVLARFGGEEFVVFLPNTNKQDAKTVAERIRRIVETTSGPAFVSVTASIGVAEFLPGETVDMAMDRADHALLGAKQQGRNRVVVA